MARRKYLYRVSANWTDLDKLGPRSEVRHYQSKQAAEHRAAVWRSGREEEPPPPGASPEDPGLPPIPKADRVVIERSAPIDSWTEIAR
jgi:hypothetical protein